MNTSIKILLTVSIIAILFITPFTKALALEDAIIAVVNDDVITLKDLQKFLNSLYMHLRVKGRSEAEIQEKMESYQNDSLNKLIEEKLLINAADKKGIIVQGEAIERKLNETRSQYLSDKDFLDSVVSEGLTVTDLQNKIANDMKVRFIIKFEVGDKIFVNPHEVTDYYEKNADKFKLPESFNLESIAILYRDDKAAAKQKVQEALNRLSVEKDFNKISDEFSDLPAIGIVKKGQMLPKIEEAILSLELNEISPPIETEEGIFIIKLIEKYPPKLTELSEVRDSIYQAIYKEKYRKALTSFLAKLKSEAYIEIKQ